MRRAMGWHWKEAVLMTRERLQTWRSTPWWKNTKALNMRVDPCNHISWKHKWDWHRGCVWREIPSEWSGEEEWGTKKEKMAV